MSDQITVEEDMILVTSILSNGQDKLAYAVISDCINATPYENSCERNFTYQIWIKTLADDSTRMIYETTESYAIARLLIPTAQAGGCPSIFLPDAWSPDDKSLVIGRANPSNSCGSGTGDDFTVFYHLNIETGEITEATR